MNRLFGTDGIRGKVNKTLTNDLVFNLGLNIKKVLSEEKHTPKVLIGIDPRNSSVMLASALISALLSVGCDIDYLGVTSTPSVAYLVKRYGYDIGIMISASHNAFEYNGIKIFNCYGEKLEDELEDKLEKAINGSEKPQFVTVESIGKLKHKRELIDEYISYLASISKLNSPNKLNIIVDCANGSTSEISKKLLSKLNINTIYINDKPDGFNINYNSGATNLKSLTQKVIEYNFDLGVAFDGDGDRIMIVDNKGNLLDGDYILSVIAVYLRSINKLKNDTIVGTIMTNLGLINYLKKSQINLIQTKVGDRFVYEKMKSEGYSLGGEASGHIIIRDYLQTGDGLLSLIILLNALEKMQINVSEIKDIWKKTPQKTINIKSCEKEKICFLNDDIIKKYLKDLEENLGENTRIVVRTSGTEELIRVMVESSDEKIIQEYLEKIELFIKERIKKYY